MRGAAALVFRRAPRQTSRERGTERPVGSGLAFDLHVAPLTSSKSISLTIPRVDRAGEAIFAAMSSTPGPRVYKYYDMIMASFVCVLLCANLIGVSKITEVTVFGRTFTFGAGNLFFPLSYLFGDVL